MDTHTLIEGLKLKRALVHGVLVSFEQVIAYLEATLAVKEARAEAAPVKARTLARRVKAARPRLVKPAPAAKSESVPSADGSKTARYRVAVLKVLGRFEHGADGTVIRREVARECGVNPDKDERFRCDVGNALNSLKAAGRLDRSGQVWALVRQAG